MNALPADDTPSVDTDPIPDEPTPSAAPPPPVTAFDRVQERSSSPEASEGMSWSWLAGLVFLIVGIVGVWFWVNREPVTAEPDLYRLAVSVAPEFRPLEITNDPDQAASFLLERFGLSLFPPELDGFNLIGVGPVELGSGVEVPAFRYDGADNSTVVVFMYDYILLDEAAEKGILRLAPEAYARLAEPEPVDSRRVDGAYVVSWRRRSTIFSAVAPGEAAVEQLLQSVRRAEL